MNARHGLVTRRRFIRSTIGGAAAVTGAPAIVSALAIRGQGASTHGPWYRRAYLWGQTNITEKDPIRYDIDWWRGYWKRTGVQAVIINAGGIVAYYPSHFPLHHRAEKLGDRDLYGEIVAAAREEGLTVLARMQKQLERFFDEMERILVELETVRGNLVSVSASTDSANQQRLAADVRGLRDEVGAVAEGMSEAYETPVRSD